MNFKDLILCKEKRNQRLLLSVWFSTLIIVLVFLGLEPDKFIWQLSLGRFKCVKSGRCSKGSKYARCKSGMLKNEVPL